MVRKSRKNVVNELDSKFRTYRESAYMRLSMVKENNPSNSIENRLRIIEDFVLPQDDIWLEDYYIDINASSTTFKCYDFHLL